MEASITLKNIGKRHKKKSIITDLSLGIEKGTTFTIIGKDGAGKSTLLKILAGLIEIDNGKVYIQGQDINQYLETCRQNISYLPAHNIHDPWLTCQANLHKIKNSLSTSEYNFDKITREFIDLFEMNTHMRSKPAHLPKGIRRRLDLLLILTKDPAILLLDEPLKDLDYYTRRKLLVYLNRIKNEKTTVIATDEFTEIETITDRWIVLHNGSIRYDGDLETMISHVELDFTGYLEIKQEFKETLMQSLRDDSKVKEIQNLGNTVEIKTASADHFFTFVHKHGENKFCRIAGNSVDMNYLLDQLTSDEGY